LALSSSIAEEPSGLQPDVRDYLHHQ